MQKSMNEGKFHFLSANHDVGGCGRQAWEVEKAKALSHAARVAHQKRSGRKKDSDQPASRPVQQLRSVSTGLLDPFVALSTDLTVDDRNLLQGYLITVPQEFYGTSAASLLCPVRDVTLGVLATNQILLSWAILFMQHRYALLRNIHPYSDTLLLRRRQKTYKIIGIKIHDQHSAISEDAMYGLAFSALIEHRIGDKLTAQKHLQACLTTRRLRLQQGLTVWSYPTGTLCVPVCMQVGVPQYFHSLEDVDRAGSTLKKLLCSLQEWRYGSGHEHSDGHNLESIRSIWSETTRHHYNESMQEQRSILRHHLMRSLQETSVTDNRLCLGLLITISLSLLAFQQHGDGAIEFLQLITRCFSESDPKADSEKTPVTMLGMLYITIMCIDRVQSSITGPKYILDLWQTVEIAEFLMLAAPSSRFRVKQDLVSWILDDMPDPTASIACDRIFMEHIIEDVKVAWLSQHPFEAQISPDHPAGYYLPKPTQSDVIHHGTGSAKILLKPSIARTSSNFSGYTIESLDIPDDFTTSGKLECW